VRGLRDKGQLLQTVKALCKMDVTVRVISISWGLYHICTFINEGAVASYVGELMPALVGRWKISTMRARTR
jgi:hypothetical protein